MPMTVALLYFSTVMLSVFFPHQRDTSPIYVNGSGMAMTPSAAQTADTDDQDDVHNISIRHRNQEVPL
jgi:hypothetical protein